MSAQWSTLSHEKQSKNKKGITANAVMPFFVVEAGKGKFLYMAAYYW